MSRRRILSGMRTTGRLHLGHYMGVLVNWAKLQETEECFFFAADWHALTTEYANPGLVKASLTGMMVDWLAAGIDPEKATIFVQSWVPEHAELHLLFSMSTPLSWLERVPTYKDQIENLKHKDLGTYGFLGYPLLQSADILVYRADGVPVGEDQVPHIELTREVARRFNHLYGEKVGPDEPPRGPLIEPQALLTPASKLLGTDGRKMSKSYNNFIALGEAEESAKKKIMTMTTDTQRVRRTDPGDPDVCPVFDYHKAFSDQATRDEVAEGCRSAGIGCIDCKKKLWAFMDAELAPIRERVAFWEQRPREIEDLLVGGSLRARREAEKTMAEVRKAMGLPDHEAIRGGAV